MGHKNVTEPWAVEEVYPAWRKGAHAAREHSFPTGLEIFQFVSISPFPHSSIISTVQKTLSHLLDFFECFFLSFFFLSLLHPER